MQRITNEKGGFIMSVRLSNYDLDDIRQQALYKAHKKIEGMLMLVEFIEGQIENVILALSKKTEESVDVLNFMNAIIKN